MDNPETLGIQEKRTKINKGKNTKTKRMSNTNPTKDNRG
jgi:hypothetical protein